MGESPTQHGNNDQHIQYVSDMYMSGRVYIYNIVFLFFLVFQSGAVFLSVSCMEELVK